MKAMMQEDLGLAVIELLPEEPGEHLEEGWFADRRSGSIPPPRTKSVPPMGDDDVDPWLR